MKDHLIQAARTVVPRRDDPHGPLSGLLVLLTAVTGLVDAFSYLALGHVFVANMTGNVVFLAFSVGGSHHFVWWASLMALATFALGAVIGGRFIRRFGSHRGRHLLIATGTQTVLVGIAFVVATIGGRVDSPAVLTTLVMLLGAGMGLQNSTARALGVPDLTTTVLTLTLTGVASGAASSGTHASRVGRRAVSVLSMFVGALFGAALVTTGHACFALLAAGCLLLLVTAFLLRHRGDAAWTAAPAAV
ncbi:YoaK family protein [Frondihabitans australicus]|uniref:Uncharacterized membrane protein YoaK (UPF0700 family) n=1 Tax=Frondihabitans australicus TaxID=386892 RepID=A0A495IL41_9MICO|nr:YoaK family protein [Frondihabitans australicus]RKR75876.1 uncharacterized membrane protein YoaK (UPF0700 family) [Frondihabitans australicus]